MDKQQLIQEAERLEKELARQSETLKDIRKRLEEPERRLFRHGDIYRNIAGDRFCCVSDNGAVGYDKWGKADTTVNIFDSEMNRELLWNIFEDGVLPPDVVYFLNDLKEGVRHGHENGAVTLLKKYGY